MRTGFCWTEPSVLTRLPSEQFGSTVRSAAGSALLLDLCPPVVSAGTPGRLRGAVQQDSECAGSTPLRLYHGRPAPPSRTPPAGRAPPTAWPEPARRRRRRRGRSAPRRAPAPPEEPSPSPPCGKRPPPPRLQVNNNKQTNKKLNGSKPDPEFKLTQTTKHI